MSDNVPSGHMTLLQRHIAVDAKSWRYIDAEATFYKCHLTAGLSGFIEITALTH